jgi:alcohol dehydrogenase class IV
MNRYDFYIPTKVFFGAGRLDELGPIITGALAENRAPSGTGAPAGFSRAAFLCCADEWMEPIFSRAQESLFSTGIASAGRFGDILPNPSYAQCREALQKIRKADADVLVVIGGGSYLDAGKWIAEQARCSLFITVPTTAGTGGEINEWAVLTDEKTHIKESLPCRAADLTLLDPTVTLNLPPLLTLCSGTDAFSHGMEAYLSRNANPITDMYALTGLGKIVDNLESCVKDGTDVRARGAMLEGAMLCGAAMLNAGLGILHCISNILPGFHNACSHGSACGDLLEGVFEYNRDAVKKERIDIIEPLVSRAVEIREQCRRAAGLERVVIDSATLETVAGHAAANINGHTNPKPVTREGVAYIMQRQFRIED